MSNIEQRLKTAPLKKVIANGQELLKQGKSKAEVSRELYPSIKTEDREVIVRLFMLACNLTEKGARTYYYNARRKA